MKKIATLQDAQDYLYRFIPQGLTYKFPGDFGLRRTKQLLLLLGSPQNKLKVIHIAGTSGKGSTAFYLSSLLKAHEFKVGFFMSPHLVDIRERFQVDNSLLSENEVVAFLTEIKDAVQQMEKTEFGLPTFFEITVALAFHIFHKKNVDYAVIETGLGGLFDGTNVVESEGKVAVITRIGHDHTEILGKTLSKIAYQKAGIIQQKSMVLTLWQSKSIRNVIENSTKDKRATLQYLEKAKNFKNVVVRNDKINFDFVFMSKKLHKLTLNTSALYQVENVSLSLATLIYLGSRDGFTLNETEVFNTLKTVQFSGRMEILEIKNKKIIIDGAHNPQKMAAFIYSLKKSLPGKKFDFIIAVKKGKDYEEMLDYIIPVANTIIATSYFNATKKQGFIIKSEEPQALIRYIKYKKFIKVGIDIDALHALSTSIASSKNPIVITGSLYLVADLYSFLNDLKKLHTIPSQ